LSKAEEERRRKNNVTMAVKVKSVTKLSCVLQTEDLPSAGLSTPLTYRFGGATTLEEVCDP
jgi:hypothetical protein